MSRITASRGAYPFIVALTLAALSGCGQRQSKVSGQVLFEGRSLPAGRITFRPENPSENSFSVELDQDGRFSVVLPVGDVQIAIDNREWAPRAPRVASGPPPGLPDDIRSKLHSAAPSSSQPTNAAKASRYIEIPERFYAIDTSGLKITVLPGDQPPHEIKLTK